MQNVNPLFPGADNIDKPVDPGYVLPRSSTPSIQPVDASKNGANAALNLIREKLARIYEDEPDPLASEKKAEVARPRSKHQQFMFELGASGKSIAEIQTAWHDYYVALPDIEKHEVWQEFYAANSNAMQHSETPNPYKPAVMPRQAVNPTNTLRSSQPAKNEVVVSRSEELADDRTAQQIRSRIRDTVTAGGRLKARHHLQSLGFGLAVGATTLFIFLFSFFNEVLIAPFIQPARAASTPIIVDPSSVAATSTPEIIIPKINLEIPADFSQSSTSEVTIENALENGIVHYPSTVLPGQAGNAAFFGHSSNNIFNPGKYKFAFVLLHELVPGDTFYITYNSKVYIYKVFSKEIVDPSDIGVLNNIAGHGATATLITCDPPGTSLHRLVVVGDQISPDPSSDGTGNNTTAGSVPASTQLPGNGPSLFSRIWNSIF